MADAILGPYSKLPNPYLPSTIGRKRDPIRAMKHVDPISRMPITATGDVPVSQVITLLIAFLQAVQNFFTAKENLDALP